MGQDKETFITRTDIAEMADWLRGPTGVENDDNVSHEIATTLETLWDQAREAEAAKKLDKRVETITGVDYGTGDCTRLRTSDGTVWAPVSELIGALTKLREAEAERDAARAALASNATDALGSAFDALAEQGQDLDLAEAWQQRAERLERALRTLVERCEHRPIDARGELMAPGLSQQGAAERAALANAREALSPRPGAGETTGESDLEDPCPPGTLPPAESMPGDRDAALEEADVERVARAICKKGCDDEEAAGYGRADCPPCGLWKDFQGLAQVAIATLKSRPSSLEEVKEETLTEALAALRAIPTDFNDNSYADLIRDRHGDQKLEAAREKVVTLALKWRAKSPHWEGPEAAELAGAIDELDIAFAEAAREG